MNEGPITNDELLLKIFKAKHILVYSMKKIITKGLFIAGAALFLVSCGGNKELVKSNIKNKAQSAEEYLAQRIDYNTFSGKAKMNYQGDGESQQFTANIRMNKGKDIWTSITALGGIIEAARAYITPEQLQARNAINRKYYDLSYNEGLTLIQAQVSFADLQDLIAGNPLLHDVPVQSSNKTDSVFSITKQKDDITEILNYNIKTGLLESIALHSKTKGFDGTITYSAYAATTNKLPFAYSRTIDITNKGKQVHLDMNFTKAELNVPVDMPYSVPSSYEKVGIKK
jgi:hypothetical protein